MISRRGLATLAYLYFFHFRLTQGEYCGALNEICKGQIYETFPNLFLALFVGNKAKIFESVAGPPRNLPEKYQNNSDDICFSIYTTVHLTY